MPDLTCAEVDDRDLEAGYLAGRLSAEEADAFEAHYFACERCWRMLETALAVRVARGPRRGLRVTWRTLAAAAALVLAAGAGTVLLTNRSPSEDDVLRGIAEALPLDVRPSAAGLSLAWPPRAGADQYRIRLFQAEGALLLERSTTDTTMIVPLPTGAAFVEVAALDPLLAERGSSGLVPVPGPR